MDFSDILILECACVIYPFNLNYGFHVILCYTLSLSLELLFFISQF